MPAAARALALSGDCIGRGGGAPRPSPSNANVALGYPPRRVPDSYASRIRPKSDFPMIVECERKRHLKHHARPHFWGHLAGLSDELCDLLRRGEDEVGAVAHH